MRVTPLQTAGGIASTFATGSLICASARRWAFRSDGNSRQTPPGDPTSGIAILSEWYLHHDGCRCQWVIASSEFSCAEIFLRKQRNSDVRYFHFMGLNGEGVLRCIIYLPVSANQRGRALPTPALIFAIFPFGSNIKPYAIADQRPLKNTSVPVIASRRPAAANMAVSQFR